MGRPGRGRAARARAARGAARRGARIVVVLVALVALSGCLEWDVAQLADDALGGRQDRTAGSALARDHIVEQISAWGPGFGDPATGLDAYLMPFAQGTNVVGVIEGTDLADEYVVVGAHYDGLGSSCRTVKAGDTVCNGATDNATGVAAVLAVGRMLDAAPTPPRRSVILAFWDREEDDLGGSRAFVAAPPVPLSSISAYVNLDIQGANLRPSVRRDTFAVGPETGGPVLEQALARAATRSTLTTHPLSYIFGLNRSDHAVFDGAGIPSVFLTDSTGPCYHTNADDIDAVDFAKLAQQVETVRYLVADLARSSTRPTHVPSTARPLGTYADAVQLLPVFTRALDDLATFTPTQRTQLIGIQQTFQDIVDAGPAAFDQATMTTMLTSANSAVNLMTSGTCASFAAEG